MYRSKNYVEDKRLHVYFSTAVSLLVKTLTWCVLDQEINT